MSHYHKLDHPFQEAGSLVQSQVGWCAMIVGEAFRPFSPSEAVSLVPRHRAEALVYAGLHNKPHELALAAPKVISKW